MFTNNPTALIYSA